MTYTPIISSSRISKGYGYTAGGENASAVILKSTEKYDDVVNAWTVKADFGTANYAIGAFSLNNHGYIFGGFCASRCKKTWGYDDIANTWTNKADLNLTRNSMSAFYLNSYGYISGGEIEAGYTNKTDKYDDVLNTWTAVANLNTTRTNISGFSLNGYGYTAGGYVAAVSAATEKYDDVLNTWTAKFNLNTARNSLSAFFLNSYGYTAGGWIAANTAVTERYDDIANTWTAKANLNTADSGMTSYSLNSYGYVVDGYPGIRTTQKYDDILNTWTNKADIINARRFSAGFSLGNLQQSIQNPDIQEIIKHSNKEMIPVDQTASRAIDGTAYTNTSSSNIFITVSARCIIDTAADVANIQAFSDTAADPTTAASGIVGIEGGLAGEDVSVQLSFIVRPYKKYKVVSTISAGCSATLGKWFETILK